MTTTEDILNPYDRNLWFYNQDENIHVDVMPLNFCCDMEGSKHDITKFKFKVDKNYKSYKSNEKNEIHELLRVKHYIKIGEECPICYEPIYTKKTALLSDCGHCFHNYCIAERDKITELNFKSLLGQCPYCRQSMGMYECEKIRYQTLEGPTKYSDAIENYWDNCNLLLPMTCEPYLIIEKHYLGFKKDCTKCKNYRENGRTYR